MQLMLHNIETMTMVLSYRYRYSHYKDKTGRLGHETVLSL